MNFDDRLYLFLQTPIGLILLFVVTSGVLWIPLVFLAWAIGRRTTSIRFLFVLLAVEGACMALAIWLAGIAFVPRQISPTP
mgnify:CR=1 FL=1